MALRIASRHMISARNPAYRAHGRHMPRRGGTPSRSSKLAIRRSSAKTDTKVSAPGKASTDVMTSLPENSVCGLFFYQEPQLNIVAEFASSIRSCAFAFGAVAAATVGVTTIQAGDNSGPEVLINGLTVGDVAYWGDSILIAMLMNYTAAPFEQIPKSGGAAMALTFTGLNRLTVTFQQLALGAVSVGTVSILESAIKWPVLVTASSALLFVFGLVRSAAMWYIMTDPDFKEASYQGISTKDYAAQASLIDRWAIKIAFGYIAIFEQKRTEVRPEHEATVASSANMAMLTTITGDEERYEFSPTEERILKVLVDAGNTLALAMYFQAVATGLLVVADAATGDFSECVTDGISVLSKAVAATLILKACDSFDMALYTEGSDVEHLMDGLGEESLTQLFHSLSVLAWGVAVASTLTVLIPWVESSPIMRGMNEGFAHLAGDMIVEGLNLLKAAVRILK